MDTVEVEVTNQGGRAIVEGKTSVPFKTFVTLILQRKVQAIFKTCQNEPVIVSSELLTALASAPNDRQEDRAKLVLVTFGVGIVGGVFVSAAALLAMMFFRVEPNMQDLATLIGVIAGVAVLGLLLQSAQKKPGMKDRLFESMEKVTDLIAR